jgi:hypothetical protein
MAAAALCFARMMAEDTDETTQTLVLALGIVWASQAAGDPINQFISFGDSSVDSGWWSGALQGQSVPASDLGRNECALALA